jgi:PhnB protein
MQLQTYLAFDGNCETAMNFYKDIFDGEITMLSRFKEMPEEAMCVPETAHDLVMHCTLQFRDCLLMASDTVDSQNFKQGNNYSISVNVDNEAEAATIFAGLSDQGQIIMPFADAFWGGKFGMLVDQFGVQWMLSSAHK